MLFLAVNGAGWKLRGHYVLRPSLFFWMNPFSGIDPIAVLDLQKIIFDLKGSGNRCFDHRPQCARNAFP